LEQLQAVRGKLAILASLVLVVTICTIIAELELGQQWLTIAELVSVAKRTAIQLRLVLHRPQLVVVPVVLERIVAWRLSSVRFEYLSKYFIPAIVNCEPES
jgi:hypothetical protein